MKRWFLVPLVVCLLMAGVVGCEPGDDQVISPVPTPVPYDEGGEYAASAAPTAGIEDPTEAGGRFGADAGMYTGADMEDESDGADASGKNADTCEPFEETDADSLSDDADDEDDEDGESCE